MVTLQMRLLRLCGHKEFVGLFGKKYTIMSKIPQSIASFHVITFFPTSQNSFAAQKPVTYFERML